MKIAVLVGLLLYGGNAFAGDLLGHMTPFGLWNYNGTWGQIGGASGKDVRWGFDTSLISYKERNGPNCNADNIPQGLLDYSFDSDSLFWMDNMSQSSCCLYSPYTEDVTNSFHNEGIADARIGTLGGANLTPTGQVHYPSPCNAARFPWFFSIAWGTPNPTTGWGGWSHYWPPFFTSWDYDPGRNPTGELTLTIKYSNGNFCNYVYTANPQFRDPGTNNHVLFPNNNDSCAIPY